MPRAAQTDLSPAEWASFALLAEQPAHGFAVEVEQGPGGSAFADAMKQGSVAVEGLTVEVEANYKLELG